MARATTIRFSDEVFARLDQASARTGMPVNSIVVAACLEWMQRHTPGPTDQPGESVLPPAVSPFVLPAPRWATIRRALGQAISKRGRTTHYPFDHFSENAKQMLIMAQREADLAGFHYIGTEHLLLAAFGADFHSARVLAELKFDQETVRAAITAAIGRRERPHPRPFIPTSRVKRVIEIAFDICASQGAAVVGTHHILLALAREREGIAGHVLHELGATAARIEAEVNLLSEAET